MPFYVFLIITFLWNIVVIHTLVNLFIDEILMQHLYELNWMKEKWIWYNTLNNK
jgi:hypothetical protein